jgi:arylformamidase
MLNFNEVKVRSSVMPYVLSPIIHHHSPGMWSEGHAYEKKSIYSIEPGKMPPVNYDEHIIRPHSLTHLESPAHTLKDGRRIDSFYRENISYFYGKTLVLKLEGNHFEDKGNLIYHWVITSEQIKQRIKALRIDSIPDKVLISIDNYPKNNQGFHDPNYVLTLSQEAADFLISHPNFNLYGTSWKSSDFNPGKPDRPIHNTLFSKALILENLDLQDVPEGTYFMSAFPLPINDSSESPVVPVLFSKDEILNCF